MKINIIRSFKSFELFPVFLFFIVIFGVENPMAQDYEFVGQYEGQNMAIGLYNNFVYFNSGSNVHILRKSEFDEFFEINNFYNEYGATGDITINNGRMFLAAPGMGVQIYDLTDPLNPEPISIAITPNNVGRTIISDTILVALADDMAHLFSISDIQNPDHLASINFDYNQNHCYTLNNDMLYGFLLGSFSGPEMLVGYNVREFENPDDYKVWLILSQGWGEPWPDCMDSYNDMLFVAFNDTVKIYDISDVDTIAYYTQFAAPGEINNMQIHQDTAFLSIPGEGIFVYDITDLPQPDLITVYEQPFAITNLEISHDYLFCGSGTDGFRIADKSDLQSIHEVYEFTQTDAVYAVSLKNKLAYFGMKNAGLQIVDLTDKANPVDYGNLEMPSNIERIESYGEYLYCTLWSDSVIRIINVADSLNPYEAGAIQTETSTVLDYCIDNDRLYMFDGFDMIKIYSLANPGSPALISTIQEKGSCLAAKDSILVVGVQDSEYPLFSTRVKLFILEENDISLKQEIIIGEGGGNPPYQLKIDYPYVYAIRLYKNLTSLNISGNISICDQINLSLPRDLTLNGKNIYVSGRGIFIIDKTDPYNLAVIDTFQNVYGNLVLSDDLMVIASKNTGYYVYTNDYSWIEEFTDEKNKFNLYAYPNPADQQTTISFSVPENEKSKLEVFDLSGIKMIETDVSNMNSFNLKTINFVSGVYLYRLTSNGSSGIYKFIVTH